MIAPTLSVGSQTPKAQPILSLKISGPQIVTEGDSIALQEFITNISNHEVSFATGEGYSISLHDEHGAEVKRNPGNWAIAGSSQLIQLKPGETIKDFDMSFGREYELSPGSYTLQLKKRLGKSIPNSNVLLSNEITIKIIAPNRQLKQ
jgi:hypothetical protein